MRTVNFVYPAQLTRGDDGVTLTFPDLPDAITCGDNEAEALANAEDALTVAIGERLRNREPIPDPSREPADLQVALAPLIALRAALWRALQRSELTFAEVAQRLGMPTAQLNALLDPDNGSGPDELMRTLQALGIVPSVTVREADELDDAAAL